MTTNQIAVQASKCPANGNDARWCLDQSHVACWTARREANELDREIERSL